MELRVVDGSGGTVYVSDTGDAFAYCHPVVTASFGTIKRFDTKVNADGYVYFNLRQSAFVWYCREVFDELGVDMDEAIEFSRKQRFVHRLVCRAFHGEPPREGMVVDHINGVKTDNRAANLRWVTNAENVMLGRWRRWGCPHGYGKDLADGSVRFFKNYLDAVKEGYRTIDKYVAGSAGKLVLTPYNLSAISGCPRDTLAAYVNNENLIESYVSEAYRSEGGAR